MIDALLVAALVFVWRSGKAPSVATILLCVITYRTLPPPYDKGVTGVMLLVGGAVTRRRIRQRGGE